MSAKNDPDLLNELIALGDRLSEDRLYEIVVEEIAANDLDSVAKVRALEEALGDEKKARALYTKHRVRRIRDLMIEKSIIAEKAYIEKNSNLVKCDICGIHEPAYTLKKGICAECQI